MDEDLKKLLLQVPDKFDFKLEGRRIELVEKLNDPFIDLKPGDKGTIEYVIRNHGFVEDQIVVKWDNGSNLMLLMGTDKYKIE